MPVSSSASAGGRQRARRSARSARSSHAIANAAKSGDTIRLLTVMRDSIAAELDAGVPPRDLASLSKRVADLTIEIGKLQAQSRVKENPIVQAFGIADEPVS